MKWCDIHFQWEIWLKDKLVATLWGGASDVEKSEAYRQVIDVILNPHFEFSDSGIPHP